MQPVKIISFLVLFLALVTTNVQAQGFLKVRDKQLVNDKGENVLLRGIGLGGWMLQEGYMLGISSAGQQQHAIKRRLDTLIGKAKTEAFYNLWLANHTRKIDIDSLKAWGFNSVRLPMHYNLYTLPIEQEPVAGQQTWLEKGFAMTDSLLAWCKANKLYLILDLHATPGGQGNDLNIADRDPAFPSLWESKANRDKMMALWKKLAARYANEPFIGGYDIINEPNWGFQDTVNDRHGLQEKNNGPLRALMMDVTRVIREVDKNHVIIIEGNGWGNNYNGILPAWDNNMVLSFHKYWNYNDQQSIQHIVDMRNQNNIPVWLGETGENSNVWFTDAIRLLEKNNIGWAWWPLKKLGANNPLQVKSNPQYQALLDYWNGKKQTAPAASDVYTGLITLADGVKLENNILHRDVIDAMIRQPFSNLAKPFAANRISDGTTLNAVDYDLGINGVAYFDLDTADYHIVSPKKNVGNRGHVYRNDGVDIYRDTAPGENYYVGSTEGGEWLQYSLSVQEPGRYKLVLTTAASTDTGRIAIGMNNKMIAENISVHGTGNPTSWKASTATIINLQKGEQVLRVYVVAGGFNLKSLQFVADK